MTETNNKPEADSSASAGSAETISNRDECRVCGKLRYEHKDCNLCDPPGSKRAANRGCICPRMDNSYGKGYMGVPGVYVIREECPMHGSECLPNVQDQRWPEAAGRVRHQPP